MTARLSGARFPTGRLPPERIGARSAKKCSVPKLSTGVLAEWEKLQEQAAQALAENISAAQQAVLEEQLERGNIHILTGHDFNKPLGDLKAGNTRIWDSPEALHFETVLPDPENWPSWMADSVKAIRSDLANGLSPGFRIPPKDVVPNAETLIPEPGNPQVLIRKIMQANLFEMSIVTRPHYGGTDVSVREYMEPSPSRRWWQ